MAVSRGGIVILGMHRSGTSCLAGSMELVGAYAGSHGQMTEANIENPKGFFELREIRDVCDEALALAHADWDQIGSFSLDHISHDRSRALVRRTLAVVEQLEEKRPWILKEPRFCLLLPLIRRATQDPVILHIYRNPLEVARSLRTRNGFSIGQGLALWEAYNRAAVANSEDLPYLRISYHDLLEDPTQLLSTLVPSLTELGVGGLQKPDPDALEDFVRGGSQHERASEEELGQYLSNSQMALWLALSSPERTIEVPPASPSMSEALIDLDLTSSRMQETVELRRELAAVSAKLADRTTRLELRGVELATLSETVAGLKKRVRLAADDLDNPAGSVSIGSDRVPDPTKSRLLRRRKTRIDRAQRERDMEALRGSELFDERWYLDRYPDVAVAGIGAEEHYLNQGYGELRDPGPEFSTEGYFVLNSDVAAAGINPLIHFIVRGKSEGRSTCRAGVLSRADRFYLLASGLFDSTWYAREYPDVAKMGVDPVTHYLLRGADEARDPSADFSTKEYRDDHMSDLQGVQNPLVLYARQDFSSR